MKRAPELDLEVQIHLAEMAILQRGARIRNALRMVGGGLQKRLGRGLLMGGASLLASLLLRRLTRGLSPAARPRRRGGLGGLLQLGALVWAALPGDWRARVPPGLTKWASGLIPLFEWVFQARPGAADPARDAPPSTAPGAR